jgi:tetratricopeptide (TPR) repeat protein
MTGSRADRNGNGNGHDRDDRDGGAAEAAGLERGADDSELERALDDAAFAAADEDDGTVLLPLLDAEVGPARALSERQLLLLADRVERQFLAQRPRSRPRRSPKRWLLAGGLFAASAAAAVYGVGVVRRAVEPASVKPMPTWSRPSMTEPKLPAPSVPAPSVSAPSVLAPSEPSAPEVDTNAVERPAEPSEHTEPNVAPRTGDARPSISPSVNSAGHALRSGANGDPNPVPNAASPRQNRTVAADRLAAANGLRSRHRYREALALYLRVIETDPNGMQASVARVAAAEMQLEQFGDVAGAERLYREARTQGGELTAEAQFGLAQVARVRGDAPGERLALQDFLGRHPESPLAAAARRRLNTLGAR